MNQNICDTYNAQYTNEFNPQFFFEESADYNEYEKYKEQEYISPTLDFAFKKIFNKDNSDIVKGFLRDILDLKEDLSDIEFPDTFRNKQYKDDKLIVFDVRVNTESGEQIDIEVQVQKVAAMISRMIYYSCQMYCDQLKEGTDYNKLKKTITIVITDFSFIKEQGYHGLYHLKDEYTNETLSDLLELHILELPKVPNKRENNAWDWMKFFQARKKEEFEMAAMQNESVKKAVNVVKSMSADDEARARAFQEEKYRRDKYATEHRVEGLIQEGREEGLREGRQEGRQEGLQKGRNEAILEMASRLKKKGLDTNAIQEYTLLTKEEIDKL